MSFSLLPDQKPLRRKLTFQGPEKLLDLARRTGACAEVLGGLQQSITVWARGSVILQMTEPQLQALGGAS